MNTLGFEVKEKLTRLQDALLSSHPTIPVLLRDIHTHLRTDPEIVTLLSEDEIAIIVKGLAKQTNSVIASDIMKSPKSAANKALKNTSVDDI